VTAVLFWLLGQQNDKWKYFDLLLGCPRNQDKHSTNEFATFFDNDKALKYLPM
jgi:hypothetical protein